MDAYAVVDPTASATAPIGAIEAVLLLFVAATALAIAARRIGIPYPILLTAGGKDHTVPPGIVKATHKLYRKSPAVTD